MGDKKKKEWKCHSSCYTRKKDPIAPHLPCKHLERLISKKSKPGPKLVYTAREYRGGMAPDGEIERRFRLMLKDLGLSQSEREMLMLKFLEDRGFEYIAKERHYVSRNSAKYVYDKLASYLKTIPRRRYG